MHFDQNALKIYVDGSALKNPSGPGGIAAIVEYPDELERDAEPIFQEGYRKTTNNRMELAACIKAFQYARERAPQLGINRRIVITDSEYIYSNQSIAENWRKNKWRNVEGRPVENPDLWREFLRLKTAARVEVQLVKGKSSEILKEVDRLAKEAARRPTKIDFGFHPGRVARRKMVERYAATLFPARGQTGVIRIYGIREVAKGEREIKFEIFSESEGKYTANNVAYISAKHKLHRNHCYEVRFNDNLKYPIIKTIRELKACP